MKVGVPTEIKTDEYRVAITPAGVREFVEHEHEVVIQQGAGAGSVIPDEEYVEQGARIVPDADAVFEEAELILKVKEPMPEEVARLRPEHTLFTYLHLAPALELTKGLCDSGATCVAYETVEDSHGRLPLLAPMHHHAGLRQREGQKGADREERNQPVGNAAEHDQQRAGATGEVENADREDQASPGNGERAG